MASARNQSLSINMVMNSAIKGSNFLQVSVNKLYKNATVVQRIDLLKQTKFPLLNRNLKSLDNHLGKIRSQTAKISANPIRLDIQTSRNSLKNARKDMTAIEHDAKQVAFWTKKSADNLRAGATSQKRAGNNKIGAGVSVAGGVGMAYMLSKPFKASIEFESNMADVLALTKNISESDFLLLQEKAKSLGATTEWSASQSALGMTYLAKAGFNTKQQLGAMAGVLGLATAGNVDLATSSDIASNILSGFGIEANKMGMVSDVLAKTFTTSNTDLNMLGETMKYTAPIASGLGVGLTEVSALAGKLGDVGIQGSMAGTSLRQMYTRLSAPPTEAKKALDSLGISVFDAQGKFKGMPNIVGELNKSMAGMDDGVKTEKLKHIFGMTALSSGIALMKVGKKGLLDYKSTLDNATGTTAGIQKIKLDTTAGEFKLLGSAMESLSISATTGLLPTIRIISSGFKSVAGGLESFTQKYPNASKWVLGLGTAFIVGSVALAGFGLVASGVATAVGFISLPILGVVAGVTALATAGYFLYTKFQGVRDVVSGLGSVLGSFFGGITDVMLPVAGAFSSSFIGIGSSIMQIVRPIGSLLMGIGGLLGGFEMLRTIAKGVGWLISGVFTVITSPILAVVKIIQGAIASVGWLVESVGSVFGLSGDDKKETKSSSWFSWGSDEDKKDKPKVLNSVPVNNLDYKKTFDENSSLKETAIPKIPIESVSRLSEIAISEQKTQMQLNNSTKKEAVQNINNNITVNAIDGKIDEDDLYEKLIRVQKRIADDEKDIDLQDAS